MRATISNKLCDVPRIWFGIAQFSRRLEFNCPHGLYHVRCAPTILIPERHFAARRSSDGDLRSHCEGLPSNPTVSGDLNAHSMLR